MASISEFEPLLKEVVQAKRLSASKMTKLTELAMKCMEHDTQMVSTLYRTHKSLASAFKISSLYVFDALARAAKSQINKQGFSADVSKQTGNAVTFLSKLSGVVEGLFQDMVTSDIPESKAKSKKVLDIWVKGSTFPADQLSRLSDIVEGNKKESEANSALHVTPTPDPVASQSPSVIPSTTGTPVATVPVVPEANPQAALLALLAQAANTPSLQTNVNTPPVASLAAARQLAVLQQLTQTAANVAPALPNVSLHTLTSAPPQGNSFIPGPNRSSRSPIPGDPRRANRDESGRERQFSPETGRPHDNRSDRFYSRDPRTHARGNSRGRGWGERRRRDDRDYSNRERDKDYRGRSRSRSPPSRYPDKRGERALSPRQDSHGNASNSSWSNSGRTDSAGKDEFGRDIRPASPEPAPNSTIHPPTISQPIQTGITDQDQSTASTSNKHDGENVLAPVAPITSSDASYDSNTNSSQQGMDNFDVSTFDLRSPASWEALGKMWQVTYGCAPTGDQLLQFVLSFSMGVGAAGLPVGQTTMDQGQWEVNGQEVGGGDSWGGTDRGTNGRGYGSRGRGFHGNGRDGQRGGWHNGYSSTNDTDAIVLGGGDSGHDEQQKTSLGDYTTMALSGSAGTGGKMEKVGGKWLFVRNNDSSS